MQLMDVLTCNSANKPSFQNLTKNYFAFFFCTGELFYLSTPPTESNELLYSLDIL